LALWAVLWLLLLLFLVVELGVTAYPGAAASHKAAPNNTVSRILRLQARSRSPCALPPQIDEVRGNDNAIAIVNRKRQGLVYYTTGTAQDKVPLVPAGPKVEGGTGTPSV